MEKIVLTDSRAPRATMRMERGLPGAAASAGALAAAGSSARSTLYGLRSISLMSAGLSSRASSAALLPESHSPHWQVAMEFGRRTAITPGTSYACPHFGQRMSGIATDDSGSANSATLAAREFGKSIRGGVARVFRRR